MNADMVAQVEAATRIQADFCGLAGKIQNGVAPKISGYLQTISDLLTYTSANGGSENDDAAFEQGLGAWSDIKPKDLDFVLNDSSPGLEGRN